MHRPKSTSVIVSAAALLGLALVASACSSPPEEPLLRQFFRASQLRDNATLANFAAATFDPRTDGVVSGFDIVSVGEERRQPLMLKELAATADQARIADEEYSKKMKEYQDANLVAIERVLKAETAGQPVAARDAGMEVLGISLVTNLAAGISKEPLGHTEVMEAGRVAAPRIGRLLADVVERI